MNTITKSHILSAIKEIDEQGIRNGRHSNTYDLIYDGKPYPPKLVISIANRYATGTELDSNEFYGGPNKPAFDLLLKEGFEIIKKGERISKIGKLGNGAGEFFVPNGLFLAEDGSIFVTDTINQRIQILN